MLKLDGTGCSDVGKHARTMMNSIMPRLAGMVQAKWRWLRCAAWAVLVGLCGGTTQAQMLITHEGNGDAIHAIATSAVIGVTDTHVLFGQSAALRGSAAEIGIGARLGIRAAFQEVNAQEGVHGRRLQLITLDDGYDPERAIANTHHLIQKDNVFALVGAVGTTTTRSAAPVAARAGVPFIAPFTGDVELRSKWQNMIHLRASYDEETETMVKHLIQDLAIKRIAVVYQDDSFGRDAHAGLRAALHRRDLKLVASGVYERNTSAVKTALLDIRRAKPEAVVLICAYRAAAAMILWSRATGFDPVFMAISFVGSNALAGELGSRGIGVFVTQVVPFPTGIDLPVTVSYAQALTSVAPNAEPGFLSLEGYLAGRLIIEALRRSGRDLTRGMFLETFKQEGGVDFGGFKFRYAPVDSKRESAVFLTAINNTGRYQPIRKLTDIIQCVNC